MSDAVTMRPLASLRANPRNPRGPVSDDEVRDLAASIASVGIVQPLLVTPAGLIVAGHRRHRAAALAGLADVPVYVRDIPEAEQIACMLAENVSRAELAPSAEGRAYRALIDGGMTLGDVARRVGVPQYRVSDRVTLVTLEPEIVAQIDRGEIPLGAVRPLSQIENTRRRSDVARGLRARTLTLAEVKADARKPAPDSARGRTLEIRESVAKVKASDPKRLAVAASIAERPRRIATFRAVGEVFEATCRTCGLHTTPGGCRECPLLTFLTALSEEADHVRRTA